MVTKFSGNLKIQNEYRRRPQWQQTAAAAVVATPTNQNKKRKTRQDEHMHLASSVFILKRSPLLEITCVDIVVVVCNVINILVTVYCLCQYWCVHLRKSVNKIRIRRDINPIKMFSIHSKTFEFAAQTLPDHTTRTKQRLHCACVCQAQ